MSNTRKGRPMDYRQIEMARQRKLLKIAERTRQEYEQQRAAHARKVVSLHSEALRVLSPLISELHIHDDGDSVEGCPGCFGGEDLFRELHGKIITGEITTTEAKQQILELVVAKAREITKGRAEQFEPRVAVNADLSGSAVWSIEDYEEAETESFPIVCENGCPEGHLGRHKMSCAQAAIHVEQMDPEGVFTNDDLIITHKDGMRETLIGIPVTNRIDDPNSRFEQQRAAHARKVADEHSEIFGALGFLTDHNHDDDGTVYGCQACFGGEDMYADLRKRILKGEISLTEAQQEVLERVVAKARIVTEARTEQPMAAHSLTDGVSDE